MIGYNLQNFYNEQIFSLRQRGDLHSAISYCQEAIEDFPYNNFYYKLLGDLCLQSGKYTEASKAYINNLKLIGDKPQYFKIFVKFYNYLLSLTNDDFMQNYRDVLICNMENNSFSASIVNALSNFLNLEYPLELTAFLRKSDDDKNFAEVTSEIKAWEQNNEIFKLNTIVSYRINISNRNNSKNIDNFIVSVLERLNRIDDALQIAYELALSSNDPTTFRTLMRLCRKREDYSIAEKLMKKRPELLQRIDFNTHYELVYYYNHKENEQELKRSLQHIYRSAQGSLPISNRTKALSRW